MRTLCFLLFPFCLSAQKNAVRQEIESINRIYAGLTELRSEIDYVMYATHTGTEEIDRQKAVLSRSGDMYLYKIGSIETLTTPSFTVVADHEDKELLLDKVRSQSKDKQFGLDMSLALDACDTVFLSESAPGIRRLILEVSLPDIEKVELRYHSQTRMMQKVTLFYREVEEWEDGRPKTKARMEINYRQQERNPVFASDLFSIERFVRQVGGKFAPASKFKNYTLFNQIDAQ